MKAVMDTSVSKDMCNLAELNRELVGLRVAPPFGRADFALSRADLKQTSFRVG